ncbi:MAG: metallophosphoesterase family protein [Candidatus Methanomethylicaceae archaeon]
MNRFQELMKNVTEILRKEGGKSFRSGSLLKLKETPITIIGDLHGDYLSLEAIMSELEVQGEVNKIVFLGDYADRGPSPLEVYEKLFDLKSSLPDDVFLLRGNHEALDLIEFYPHDLPWHLQNAYGGDWKEVYESIMEIHRRLPIAVLVEGLAVLLHGGVSPDITKASLERPSNEELEIVLWSDPSNEIKGTIPSNRGAGVVFGADVSFKVLDELGVRYMIRGHSPVRNGYRWDHSGRVLTIFSAKNVYGLENGAYAILSREDSFIKVNTF